MNKVVIFHGIDNFGNEYKYYGHCKSEDVDKFISREKRLSTEITSTEVVDCSEF